MSIKSLFGGGFLVVLLVLGAWVLLAPTASAAPNEPVPAPSNLTNSVVEVEPSDLAARIVEIQKQIDEFNALKELDLLTPSEQRELESLQAELKQLQSQADADQDDQDDDQIQPAPVSPNPGSMWVSGWIAYHSISSPTGFRAVEPTVMVWRRADDPWRRVTAVSDWTGRFQLRLRPGHYIVDFYLRPWWRPIRNQPTTVHPGMREPYFVVSPMRTPWR